MSEETSTSLAKTFTKAGSVGIFICVMFVFGFYIFLDYKENNNHILHQTVSDVRLNDTLMQMTGVLSSLETTIRDK